MSYRYFLIFSLFSLFTTSSAYADGILPIPFEKPSVEIHVYSHVYHTLKVAAGVPLPEKKEKVVNVLRKNFEIDFFPAPPDFGINEEKPKPFLILDSTGVLKDNKYLCTWNGGKFDPVKDHGKSALLKNCDEKLPFKTIQFSGEDEAKAIFLNIMFHDSFDDQNGKKWYQTEYKGMKLYFELSDFKNTITRLGLKETEKKVIALLHQGKDFLDFKENLKKCLLDKEKDCLRNFTSETSLEEQTTRNATLVKEHTGKIKSSGRYHLWDHLNSGSLIKCPRHLKSIQLSQQEFIECIKYIPNLQDEILRCLDKRELGSVRMLDAPRDILSPVNHEKFIQNEENFITLQQKGRLFNCYFSRVRGTWILNSLLPDFERIKELVSQKYIALDSVPSSWPFKEVDQKVMNISREILYRTKYYFMRPPE